MDVSVWDERFLLLLLERLLLLLLSILLPDDDPAASAAAVAPAPDDDDDWMFRSSLSSLWWCWWRLLLLLVLLHPMMTAAWWYSCNSYTMTLPLYVVVVDDDDDLDVSLSTATNALLLPFLLQSRSLSHRWPTGLVQGLLLLPLLLMMCLVLILICSKGQFLGEFDNVRGNIWMILVFADSACLMIPLEKGEICSQFSGTFSFSLSSEFVWRKRTRGFSTLQNI